MIREYSEVWRGGGWARGDCGATRRLGCVIPGLRGCLLCSVAVAAEVLADAGTDAPPENVLAQALGANRQLVRLVEELRAETARRQAPVPARILRHLRALQSREITSVSYRVISQSGALFAIYSA